MAIYIGIDCGTTTIKIVAFNNQGKEIEKYSEKNNAVYVDERAEQSMSELWEKVHNLLKKMIGNLGKEKEKIKAIAVTGQGEGLWTLDSDFEPIEPAVLWNDGRSSELIKEIKMDKKKYETLKLELGTYLKPGSTLTLLKWLKDYRREQYNNTAIVFSCKDWIRFKLTGDIYWELSDASCSNVDLNTGNYSLNAYKLLDVEEVVNKLPPLISSTKKAGVLSASLSKEFEIYHKIPISAGMIDIVSTSVGQGAISNNDISVILGTTGMTFSVLNKYTPDLKFNGWETHLDCNQFIKGMGTMAATPNLDWILEILHLDKTKTLNSIDKYFKNYKPFQSGVLYHPHISVSGERAPFYNNKATAQFLGLNQNTSSKDLIHAVLEGVVLSISDCLIEVKKKKNIYVSGGGANSSVWLQMLSDCLGVEIRKPKGQELAAKGAVLSAIYMLDDGVISKGKTELFCQTEQIFYPNMDYHKQYRKIFKLYKETQKNMESFWKQRADLIEKSEY